jgi:hypothetical protein
MESPNLNERNLERAESTLHTTQENIVPWKVGLDTHVANVETIPNIAERWKKVVNSYAIWVDQIKTNGTDLLERHKRLERRHLQAVKRLTKQNKIKEKEIKFLKDQAKEKNFSLALEKSKK